MNCKHVFVDYQCEKCGKGQTLDDKDVFTNEDSEIARMRWFLGASIRLCKDSGPSKAYFSVASYLKGRDDGQIMHGVDAELRELGLLP